jgi:CRP-like cAMP-binding protein
VTASKNGPRKSDDVTLHEVESSREGTRYVLKHERSGDYFDLPSGEQDAFVWARLDGQNTVGQLAQLHLEEFGTIHSDLPGLLRRLAEAGMLADTPRTDSTLAGRRLTQLAANLVMVRLPIPWSEHFWRGVGRVAAPFYSVPAGLLGVILALVGLVLALGPANALAGGGTPLLEWPLAARPLLVGIGVLLAFNLLVDLFEAVAQVAVLARGGRAPGRIGLSFDMGIPGIYIETPDSILLPVELRRWLLLSPLLAAGFVGGLATIAAWRLGWPVPGEEILIPLILHKLAWIAWLRCVIHLNPVGPSPVYDTLCAWWSLPRLRSLALKALRGRALAAQDGDAMSRRELSVLTYIGLCIAFFVMIARLGTYLLHEELLPEWNSAMASADTLRVMVLAILLVVLGLPTLLALGGGLLMSLQAGVRALARSDLFPSAGRLAWILSLFAVGVAAAPRFLAATLREPVQTSLLWGATFLAGVGLAEGIRLRKASGAGWGAMGGVVLALTCGLLLLLNALLIVGIPGSSVLQVFAAMLILSMALGVYSWALLESYRAWTPPAWLPILGVLCLPTGMLPGTEHAGNPIVGPVLLPAICLLVLSAFLGAAAWVRSRGSFRESALALLTLGPVVLAGGLSSWWVTGDVNVLLFPGPEMLGGVHMPLFAAALLATGTWLLRRARREQPRLPDVNRALNGKTFEERQVAACTFVLQGLHLGLRDVFGRGTTLATTRVLEDQERIKLQTIEPPVLDLADHEDPVQRAWRYRYGVAEFYRLLGERVGEQFGAHLLEHVVARLPAKAHETIADSGPSTLPVIGAVAEVPADERLRLLRRAVPFSDFTLDSLSELSDRCGLRRYESADVIIVQGDVGDTFYMLAKGTAVVYLEDAGGEERAIATLHAGDAFGEAALLRHEPRAASVVAGDDCLVLTLDRGVFSSFMQANKDLLEGVFARQEDLRLLREVPLFAGLSGEQVSVLCRRLRPLVIEADVAVISKGEIGDRFYLVRDGTLEVRVPGEGDETKTVAHLARGEYFGEIALLNDTPRSATVVATARCELLALERDDFHALLSGRTGERLARRSLERIKELQASSTAPRVQTEEE